MDAAVGSFLEYQSVERGASPHTLRSYTADLTEFSRFLAAEKIAGWEEADTRAVRAYLACLHKRKLQRRLMEFVKQRAKVEGWKPAENLLAAPLAALPAV